MATPVGPKTGATTHRQKISKLGKARQLVTRPLPEPTRPTLLRAPRRGESAKRPSERQSGSTRRRSPPR